MSKTQEDLKILEGFVNALTIELAESKKRNVEKQIIIENGERGEKLGSKFLYTFFLDQDLRIGRAKDDILILKPKNEINQAVTVVPIFAPIITPIDSISDNNPALAKLTTITVVAEEDWIKRVIRKPVKTPNTLFLVMLLKIWRSLFPAAF